MSHPSRSSRAFLFGCLLAASLSVGLLSAQQPLKTGNNAEATARTPAEQLQTFKVPPGFIIELVASEETGLPKPIAVAFDDAGRMWSMTATEYPRDNEPGFWSSVGKDRVVVFDTPLAAGPQTPRTFADGLLMPMSVLPYRHGVIVAQGPEIVFLDDTDGDGRADRKEVLLRGFGVQDTHTMPHQLEYLPGNWIAFSQGVLNNGTAVTTTGKQVNFDKTVIARFRPDGSDLEVIGTGLNNIWSWVMDRSGRVFFHEANDFGYAIVPFERDTSYPSFIKRLVHPDAPLHPPTTPNLTLGGTGFSGLALSDDRSGSFPAPFHNVFFVANPITRRINTVSHQRTADGLDQFTQLPDLVSCDDELFRPIALRFGPDGCLYIVDWYNRIISHNEVDRNHPGRDKTRGRIWRVRHESQTRRAAPNVAAAPTADLVKHLQADSTWEMRAAWHQIGERQARELIPQLVALLRNPATPRDVRLAALWSLEGVRHYDRALWRDLIASDDADLRREVVRALGTAQPPLSEVFALVEPLASEPESRVRSEVLRVVRDHPEPLTPAQWTWLQSWKNPPQTNRTVQGWEGPYLALGGPYEKAFQNLLLQMVQEKGRSRTIPATDPKWTQVLRTQPPMSAAEQDKIRQRLARLIPLVDAAKDVDPKRGQGLFLALCSGCHSTGPGGQGFAPSLAGSQNRSTEAVLTAMLDPNQAFENIFRAYRVELVTGDSREGFLSEQTAESLTLQFQGGRQVIPLGQIKAAGYIDGKSAMPDGLVTPFPDRQIVELVRYVQSLR